MVSARHPNPLRTSPDAIQLTADGRFALAVDAGSNEVSVLRVQDGGKLKLVPGGTVSSGGSSLIAAIRARMRVC